ncbi:MAG: TonB-dependent receptor, partial [Cyclobacteriaceae bacterium]|nr:TonB-dependent receptor [Cyclobacteriaceae bacterium]
VYNEGYASNHGSDYSDPAVVNDTIHRWYGKWDYTWHNYQTNLFALFKFNTGKIKHQLLTGLDYNLQKQPSYHYTAVAAPSLNVNNPDYSLDTPESYKYTFDVPSYDYQYVTYAGYVQDQIEINKYIKLSAALRYDHYSFYWKYGYHDYTSDSTYQTDGEEITADAFIPRAGIVVNPKKNIAFYYSYSQSFEPQWLNSVNRGGPFPPTLGKQHEVGYKGEFLKDKLFTGVSLYQIDYLNVLVADPSDSTGRRYVSVQGMRSKGIELNAQGNINENLQIIANYSYGQVKYFGDAIDGSWKRTDRQLNVPRTIWGLFVNYKFTKNILNGFGINAGLHHEGDRVASWLNQNFITPAFTYADAGMSYKYKKATLYFNLNNITNEKYITGGYVTGMVYPGTPRNFRVSINYVF